MKAEDIAEVVCNKDCVSLKNCSDFTKPIDKVCSYSPILRGVINLTEISFKEGREEGFILAKVTDPVLSSKTEHKELNRRAKAFLDDVRCEGRKEMVDIAVFYDKQYSRNDWGDKQFRATLFEQLQAQLEKWGIK